MNKDIVTELKTRSKNVSLWRTRFADKRLAGIEKDLPRGGRPATARQGISRQIVEATFADKAGSRNTLEHADSCQAFELLDIEGPAGVQSERTEAASQTHVQVEQRSPVRRETDRWSWTVSQSPEHALVFCADEKARFRRSTAPRRACQSILGAAAR